MHRSNTSFRKLSKPGKECVKQRMLGESALEMKGKKERHERNQSVINLHPE